MLNAARKDGQSVTARGDLLTRNRIDGVVLAELRPVPTKSGATIEIFRADGPFQGFQVRQTNYCPLRASYTTDWHMHRQQNDVVVPVLGEVSVGLYDDREDSPTYKTSLMLRVSPLRMAAVYIPCGVWHALRNDGVHDGAYVVFTDRMYVHEDPDDWRLLRDEPALRGIL